MKDDRAAVRFGLEWKVGALMSALAAGLILTGIGAVWLRMQSLAGRIVPDDLARMVLFLAADDSRMCSAQEFIVDAGWA